MLRSFTYWTPDCMTCNSPESQDNIRINPKRILTKFWKAATAPSRSVCKVNRSVLTNTEIDTCSRLLTDPGLTYTGSHFFAITKSDTSINQARQTRLSVLATGASYNPLHKTVVRMTVCMHGIMLACALPPQGAYESQFNPFATTSAHIR